jgi:hypothetical protein
VQCRDHRLEQRDADAGDGAQQRVGGGHAPGAVDLLDVRAGAEGLFPSAGEDGNAHPRVVADLAPDRRQPFLGGDIERVEHLRPIERDDGDPVRPLLQ